MRFSYAALTVCLAASGCQSDKTAEQLTIATKSQPTDFIAKIAKSVQKCWFATKDPAFKTLRLANEVTSLSGRPRLLLVPKNNPSGLPSLVIQAEKNNSENITNAVTFGPLLSSPNGQRIVSDVQRWANGGSTCAA